MTTKTLNCINQEFIPIDPDRRRQIRTMLEFMRDQSDNWNYTGGRDTVHAYQITDRDKRFVMYFNWTNQRVYLVDLFEYLSKTTVWGAEFPYSLEGIGQALETVEQRRAELKQRKGAGQ